MATYQEQIAAAKEKREAEAAYGWLADSLMPLIEKGTITQNQASEVMIAVLRGLVKESDRLKAHNDRNAS